MPILPGTFAGSIQKLIQEMETRKKVGTYRFR